MFQPHDLHVKTSFVVPVYGVSAQKRQSCATTELHGTLNQVIRAALFPTTSWSGERSLRWLSRYSGELLYPRLEPRSNELILQGVMFSSCRKITTVCSLYKPSFACEWRTSSFDVGLYFTVSRTQCLCEVSFHM